MQLKSVLVRFYKSFNYDYERKIKTGVSRKSWEMIDGHFYPYVEIHIDPEISAIVGANESGKSHLLSTIEKGLTGQNTSNGKIRRIERKDFCRYSRFFQAARGGPKFPDFGFEWGSLTVQDKNRVRRACNVSPSRDFDRFYFFRRERNECSIYLPAQESGEFEEFQISADTIEEMAAETKGGLLPHVFRIESAIALPDTVPIEQLIKGRLNPGEGLTPSGRRFAFQLMDFAESLISLLGQIPEPVNGNYVQLSPSVATELRTINQNLNSPQPYSDYKDLQRRAEEFNLAYDLLFNIARIDIEDIKMLAQALKDSETGLVRSVIDNINDELATVLNFPRVWAQDRDFALRIETTEHELSFVIRDRTGRQYSFDERSSGLKHFLSYYIQYLRHEPQGHSEILLMDEPDAFLSGEAQQDLLKVFGMFAVPALGKGKTATPVQVIYVTHSPFLIDKNHAERVRALKKAEGSKGTRVIRAAAQNHYEPLRSAFGAFVGETTFISGCNLMVEGAADQILLAGAATYFRKLEDVPESEMLDLNRITIVPASGAANVPYLVYLARGRDAEKPAVIVLLDSDKAGDKAKIELTKQGPQPGKKRVLDPQFILQLGEVTHTKPSTSGKGKKEVLHRELEDLVPLSLGLRAAKRFARELYDLSEDKMGALNEKDILAGIAKGQSMFEAMQSAFEKLSPTRGTYIDKVPFARNVIDILPELAAERKAENNGQESGLDEFEANLRAVFRRLREMQSEAQQDNKAKTQRKIVNEKVQTFLNDHEASGVATRDDVARLLRDVESDLMGDEDERAYIVQEIVNIRADHRLSEDVTETVPEFQEMIDGLKRLGDAENLAHQSSLIPVNSRKSKLPEPVVEAPEAPLAELPSPEQESSSAAATEEEVPIAE